MPGFEIRAARLPGDEAAIAAIDTGFETDAFYDIQRSNHGFTLALKPMARFTKRFRVYDLRHGDREWDEAHVALVDGTVAGFVATSWQFWNRRLVLWHIYADRAHRGAGIGAALLETVFDRARRQQALSVWLETSNVNVPGIAWYRARGFDFAGLDMTLYEGTGLGEEKAVFLHRRMT